MKHHLYNRNHTTNLPQHWLAFQNIKKISQCECWQAHNQYIFNLRDPHSTRWHKQLWTYIKNKRKDPSYFNPQYFNPIHTTLSNRQPPYSLLKSSVSQITNIQTVIFPSYIVLWNTLPTDIVLSPDIEIFKRQTKTSFCNPYII